MKKYIPDTPKEIAFIASSISRLGTALAGISLLQSEKVWTLASVALTWAGFEINQYITMHENQSQQKNQQKNDTDTNS